MAEYRRLLALRQLALLMGMREPKFNAEAQRSAEGRRATGRKLRMEHWKSRKVRFRRLSESSSPG